MQPTRVGSPIHHKLTTYTTERDGRSGPSVITLAARVGAWRRPALRGEEQLLERDLIDADGSIRHTQTTYLPDKVEGESQGFFAIDAGITPWVEATRAMDEAQRLAQLGS